MTQPDLVSKLREVSAKWREEAASMKEALSNFQAAAALGMEQCAAELESLLGREGQAARCNYYFGGVDGGNRCQKAIHDADEGHEWRSDREGQAAQYVTYRTENISSHPIACGPSQPETEGEAVRHTDFVYSPSVQAVNSDVALAHSAFAAPSTPIVPSTAGLSAEVADAILSDMEKIVELECGCTVEENTVSLCKQHYANWRNSLAERPAPAGEVKGEK